MDQFRSWPPGADGLQAARHLGQALGAKGSLAIAFYGGENARQLAQQAVRGVLDVGGEVLLHGLSSAAQNAWAARSAHARAALFFLEEDGRLSLRLTDGWGLPLRECSAPSSAPGGVRMLRGGLDAYVHDAARAGRLGHTLRRGPRVAVTGQQPADEALRLALHHMGFPVSTRWKPGMPGFWTGCCGLCVCARDESGALLGPDRLLAAVALVELETGGGRLAVSDGTGAAMELLAAGFSRPVLRLGRDGEDAARLYRSLPWLYDGVFAAVRLCARMRASGERLEQLCSKTPRLTGTTQELAVHRPPQVLLAQLSELEPGWTTVGHTLRRRTALGWVSLIPLHHPWVRVLAESEDMEASAELCQRTLSRIRRLDEQTK